MELRPIQVLKPISKQAYENAYKRIVRHDENTIAGLWESMRFYRKYRRIPTRYFETGPGEYQYYRETDQVRLQLICSPAEIAVIERLHLHLDHESPTFLEDIQLVYDELKNESR